MLLLPVPVAPVEEALAVTPQAWQAQMALAVAVEDVVPVLLREVLAAMVVAESLLSVLSYQPASQTQP
jgi:hypothetical protein